MRGVRIALKVLGWLILSVLLLAVGTTLTVVIVGRTDWGHRKLLGIALPQIRKQLQGDVRIGRIDGDLTHGLVLRDVEVDDSEHQPAVRIRALTVRYDLLALVKHTIDLTELRAEGAWVHARPLRDGNLNFSELAKPSTTPAKPKDPNAKPYSFRIGKVTADLEAIYDPPPAPDARRIHAEVTLDAHAKLDGGDVDVGINSLSAKTWSPLVALASAKGGLHDKDGALSAKNLDLVVSADGNQLRKLLPSVKLRGRWSVALRADGPADKLSLALVAHPPAGKLEVDAKVSSRAGKAGEAAPALDTLQWSATVEAREIDPSQAVIGAPKGTVRLDARGEGKGTTGSVDVRALDAAIAGAVIHARGKADSSGTVSAVASVDDKDLSKLRTIGVKGAAGSFSLKAKIERAHEELDIDADASGKNVSFADNHVGMLALHVHSKDFMGNATLDAEKVRTPQIELDSVSLSAEGNSKAIRATLDARGPNKTTMQLALAGRPTMVRDANGQHIAGADLTISQLGMTRFNQKLAITEPAKLSVHQVIALENLVLASGDQTLALSGKYDQKTKAFVASLTARSLDINKLVRFGKPSMDLPTTSLDMTLAAHGTTASPVADLSLQGWSERTKAVVNRIQYHTQIHYGDERARGQFSITAMDESVHGKLDVPVVLTGDRPLSLAVEIKNLTTVKLRKVLPPSLAALQGRIDGNVVLGGTTLRPKLAIDVHGRSLTLGEAKDNDLAVKVKYDDKKLDAKVELALARTVKGDAGLLTAELMFPLALSSATLQQHARLVDELMHRTPLDATITLRKVDLAKMPFAQLGMTPPVDAGIIDGKLTLKGTVHEPTLMANIAVHSLKKGKLDQLELFADVEYEKAHVKAAIEARLRYATLLKVKGEAPLDFQSVIDGRPWKNTPIIVDAEVPQYPLAKIKDLMPQLDGKLEMKLAARGTIAKPTAKLDLDVAALQLGVMKYTRFALQGNYDGQKVVAHLDAREEKGGTLGGDFTLPMDVKQPLAAALEANGFYIDVENFDLTNPRVVKGTLNASLTASGPRNAPSIKGQIHFSDGKLALASDPRLYEGIKVDVGIDNETVSLQNLEAHLSDGKLQANGTVKLNGLTPKSVDLKAYATRFPIEPGNFGVWVDANVTVHGQSGPNGMTGTISIDKGTANLPKLAGGKKLQSTDALKDVRFVDPEALAAEKKRKQALKNEATTQLVAVIPGPFHVRSKELSTDLKGKLRVDISGPVARISGSVEQMSTGWIELLGRRYDLEKARIGFDGGADINPELDIRLTRNLSQTMLIIEVHGSASKPQLVLASDPPIYDQSQVIMAIISGDPATATNDPNESMDTKVTGAVSSLIVGKIKDQIAPNLPIDVLKVDTGATGTDAGGVTDTRIEVGKFITPTVYLSYVHQFGSTMVGTEHVNSNEADLNWRFYRNYEVDTAFGDAEVGHVNLFWTIRY